MNRILKNCCRQIWSNLKQKQLLDSKLKREYSQLVSRQQQTEMAIKKKLRKPDRFGILKMKSIKQLIKLHRNPNLTLTLNENIQILYRSTQLQPQDQEMNFYSTIGLNSVYYELNDLLKQDRMNYEEEPLLGRLAYCLMKYRLYYDISAEETHYRKQSVWISAMDYIMNDQFDSAYDECFFALQGLFQLDKHLLVDWQIDLYKVSYQKIEDLVNLNLNRRRYGLNELKIICKLIVINDTQNFELLEEVQFQILRILNNEQDANTYDDLYEHSQQSKDIQDDDDDSGINERNKESFVQFDVYDTSNCKYSDLINFGFYFAKSNYIASDLFVYLNNRIEEMFINNQIYINGNQLSKLIYFWQYISDNEPMYQLNPSQIEWVYMNSKIDEMYFEFIDFINLHKFIPKYHVKEDQKTQYIQYLQKKLIQMEDPKIECIQDIEKYLQLRAEQEHKGDYKQLSQEIYQYLDNQITLKIKEFDIYSVYNFLKNIKEKDIENDFEGFFNVLPQKVLQNVYKYEFDDLCYFYIELSEYEHLQKDYARFSSDLNAIKDHIKFSSMRYINNISTWKYLGLYRLVSIHKHYSQLIYLQHYNDDIYFKSGLQNRSRRQLPQNAFLY